MSSTSVTGARALLAALTPAAVAAAILVAAVAVASPAQAGEVVMYDTRPGVKDEYIDRTIECPVGLSEANCLWYQSEITASRFDDDDPRRQPQTRKYTYETPERSWGGGSRRAGRAAVVVIILGGI